MPRRAGRQPSTSRHELERLCLDMFSEHGFDAVSVDDIAAAAGIGRRTFFRYFPSKNDVVWGDFDLALRGWEQWFQMLPPSVPLLGGIRRAVLSFNSFDASNAELHRQRMRLILRTDALQAHSTLRYAEWRQIVARFAADRLRAEADDLVPQVVGHLALGASLAAYEQWLIQPDTELLDHLDRAFAVMEDTTALAQLAGAPEGPNR